MNLLALSSSRVGDGGYLEDVGDVIGDFLGASSLKIAFIPFAGVDEPQQYCEKVRRALANLHCRFVCVTPEEGASVIAESDCIMTGGGNTFKLLHDLYRLGLLERIRERVHAGIPYVGWSAGANILGATICTTNDMPIVEPQSFKALQLLPFQINPHYHNFNPAGFNGETRDDRLTEYLKINPFQIVYALPEGCYLKLQGNVLLYDGPEDGYLFCRQGNIVLKNVLAPGTKTGLKV